MEPKTRGQKGHISCTWVQCATFLTDRPFLFTHQPEKHELVRRCWDLAYCQICWIPFSGSCQVSLNSVQRFQRSRICLSQSEAGAAILFFRSARKTQTWERTLRSFPVKFCWILHSGFRGEVEDVPANQRPGRLSCFSDRHEKHKLGRGCWDLASCQVSVISVQQFQRRSRKCVSQSEAKAAILFFWSALKTQTW